MSLAKVYVERAQVDSVRSRSFGDNPEPVYQQKIWVYKSGSKFPTEYEIRLPDGIKYYQEGDYVADLQANMKPGQYGDISFAAFSRTKLVPVNAAFLDALDKAEKSLYDLLQQLDKSLESKPHLFAKNG